MPISRLFPRVFGVFRGADVLARWSSWQERLLDVDLHLVQELSPFLRLPAELWPTALSLLLGGPGELWQPLRVELRGDRYILISPEGERRRLFPRRVGRKQWALRQVQVGGRPLATGDFGPRRLEGHRNRLEPWSGANKLDSLRKYWPQENPQLGVQCARNLEQYYI